MRIYTAHNYGRRRGASVETLQRNVDSSIRLGLQLIKKGHNPFIPNLFHYVHLMANGSISEDTFFKLVSEWVGFCEALLVGTPPFGLVSGVRDEIEIAQEKGLIIYYSIDDVPDISGES